MDRQMNGAQVLEQLARSKPTLAARFGVTRLALFGSTVRDAARADSDKRIRNARMMAVLRPKLGFPSYREGLAAILAHARQ